MAIGSPKLTETTSRLNLATEQAIAEQQAEPQFVQTYVPNNPYEVGDLKKYQSNPNFTIEEQADGTIKVTSKPSSYTSDQRGDSIKKTPYIREEYVYSQNGDLISGIKREIRVTRDKVTSGGTRLYKEVPYEKVSYVTSGNTLEKTTNEVVGSSVKVLEKEVLDSSGTLQTVERKTNLTETQEFNQGFLARDTETGEYVPLETPGSEISRGANTVFIESRLIGLQKEGKITEEQLQQRIEETKSPLAGSYISQYEPSIIKQPEIKETIIPISRLETFSEKARERYSITGKGFDEVTLVGASGLQITHSSLGYTTGPKGFIGDTAFIPSITKTAKRVVKEKKKEKAYLEITSSKRPAEEASRITLTKDVSPEVIALFTKRKVELLKQSGREAELSHYPQFLTGDLDTPKVGRQESGTSLKILGNYNFGNIQANQLSPKTSSARKLLETQGYGFFIKSGEKAGLFLNEQSKKAGEAISKSSIGIGAKGIYKGLYNTLYKGGELGQKGISFLFLETKKRVLPQLAVTYLMTKKGVTSTYNFVKKVDTSLKLEKEKVSAKAYSLMLNKPTDSPEVQAELKGEKIFKKYSKFGPFAFISKEYRTESNRQLGKITKKVLPDLEPQFKREQALLIQQREIYKKDGSKYLVRRSTAKEYILGAGVSTIKEIRERPTELGLLFGVGKLASGVFKGISSIKVTGKITKAISKSPIYIGGLLGLSYLIGTGVEIAKTKSEDRPLLVGKRFTELAVITMGAGKSLREIKARQEFSKLQKIKSDTNLQIDIYGGTKTSKFKTSPINKVKDPFLQGNLKGHKFTRTREFTKVSGISPRKTITTVKGEISGENLFFKIIGSAIGRNSRISISNKKYEFTFTKHTGERNTLLKAFDKKGKLIFQESIKQEPKAIAEIGNLLSTSNKIFSTKTTGPLHKGFHIKTKTLKTKTIDGKKVPIKIQQKIQEFSWRESLIIKLNKQGKTIIRGDTIKSSWTTQIDKLAIRSKSPSQISSKTKFKGDIKLADTSSQATSFKTGGKGKTHPSDYELRLTPAKLVIKGSGKQKPTIRLHLREDIPGKGLFPKSGLHLPPKVKRTIYSGSETTLNINIEHTPFTKIYKFKRFASTTKTGAKELLTDIKLKALNIGSIVKSTTLNVAGKIHILPKRIKSITKSSLTFIKQAPRKIYRDSLTKAKSGLVFIKDKSKLFLDKTILNIGDTPLGKGFNIITRTRTSMLKDKHARLITIHKSKTKIPKSDYKQKLMIEEVAIKKVALKETKIHSGIKESYLEANLFTKLANKNKIILTPLLNIKTETSLITETIPITKTSLITETESILNKRIISETIPIVETKISPITIPIVDTALAQEVSSVTKQTPIVIPQTPTTIPIITPTISPDPFLPIPEIKPEEPFKPKIIKVKLKKKIKGQIGNQAFNTLVKEKGSFNKVNKKPLPFNKARNLGANVVENTPSASFKVVKTKKKTLIKDDKSYPLKMRFRPSKTDQNILVEKRTYRINTPGEIQGISVKGYLSKLKRTRWKSYI